MGLTTEELKSTLWDAANTLRGSAVDRTDWKGYILPLLFFKRICDVWDEETTEAAETFGDLDPATFPEAKEITIKLTARLRKHAGNPKYKALAERLEDLKNRHQQGLLVSIDFLKELLELAKDVVKLEREIPADEEIDRGKAALTELFEQAKSVDTPIMVKRVVDDIDEIVRAVRFDGWQNTHA